VFGYNSITSLTSIFHRRLQIELDQLISAHHGELRSKWGLTETSTERTAVTSASDVDTMDKLAEDLKKAGLGGRF
jgi:hypothetical protein